METYCTSPKCENVAKGKVHTNMLALWKIAFDTKYKRSSKDLSIRQTLSAIHYTAHTCLRREISTALSYLFERCIVMYVRGYQICRVRSCLPMNEIELHV